MTPNGRTLLTLAPIADMLDHKATAHGTSYGLTEAGYDVRIKQEIRFLPERPAYGGGTAQASVQVLGTPARYGRFTLASTVERFQMPPNLRGVVHDKSTWARRGLSAFNTVIEPGWRGFLTLELVYHGSDELVIPAGAGIAQVLFDYVSDPVAYAGKYQDQPDEPVPARASVD